jgi:hypothetical protein
MIDTFMTIPLEEINHYLRSYDFEIPQDDETAYGLVEDHLNTHPYLPISSVMIKDFLFARDLKSKPIARCPLSFILLSHESELIRLAKILGLSQISKDRIIRILGHLQLIDHDMSLFDLLPLIIGILLGLIWIVYPCVF